MKRARTTPGYLLVELLGAVVLIVIAAAVIVPGVVNRSESSVIDRACAQIADLDRRARTVSIADGPVVLAIEPEMQRLRLIGPSGPVASASLGLDVYILDRDNRTVQRVEFDRLGRSTEYTVYIHSGMKRSTILRFNGFTGRSYREESPDA